MRLIDADELPVRSIDETDLPRDKGLLVALKEDIDNAPTFDITKNQAYDKGFITAMKLYSRPQGEWIRTGSLGNGNAHYECSKCHYGDKHAESQEVPYCWYCGASMKKGGAE